MIYSFGDFELDLYKLELRARGAVVALEPQVFAVLALLIDNHERYVSREELLEKVWDGRIVTDSAIASRIKSARHALGDDGKAQRYIRTLHGQGFRFVADVRAKSTFSSRMSAAEAPEAPGELDREHNASGIARPSIAVLPFQLVGPEVHAGIADAVPHELIAELARMRWLLVTARGSSFRIRSADLDVREVGRLLNVRFCLSGIVTTFNRRIDVTTELADTASGEVVAAECYSGSIDDVHALLEEMRAKLLAALEIRIPLHEATRAGRQVPENLDAWSAYHLGLQHIYRFNRSDNAAAARLFEQAVRLEPGFARAHGGLSFVHFQNAFMRQSDDLARDIALARHCAEQALALDPLDPFINFAMGRSFWLTGELDRGLAWLERATALSPNYAQGIYARAFTEALTGKEMEGRCHVDLAMRLSPLDPLYYGMLGTRAFTHMAKGEDAEAAIWAERAARAPGAHVLIAMVAAVAEDLASNTEAAALWAASVKERNPNLVGDHFFKAFPMTSQAMRSRVGSALQRLGF